MQASLPIGEVRRGVGLTTRNSKTFSRCGCVAKCGAFEPLLSPYSGARARTVLHVGHRNVVRGPPRTSGQHGCSHAMHQGRRRIAASATSSRQLGQRQVSAGVRTIEPRQGHLTLECPTSCGKTRGSLSGTEANHPRRGPPGTSSGDDAGLRDPIGAPDPSRQP